MSERADFEQFLEDRLHDPEFVLRMDAQEGRRITEWLTKTTSLSRTEATPTGTMWHDPIHGNVLLENPAVNEILQTPTFQRLWDVQQHGDRWAVYSLLRARPHSRAEHSLGASHLVSRFAPDNQALQIATLLHDAGHTAFSHHGEFVFDSADTQDWHESHLEEIISEDPYFIRPILDRHGIDYVDVIDSLDHPLLEYPKPDLCADRLDYILRDGFAADFLHQSTCQEILAELAVTEDGTWYFETPWAGDIAQRALLLLDLAVYKNPMMWEIKQATRDVLEHGLERGYLQPEDISKGTDDEVLRKLWAVSGPDTALDVRLREFTELGIPRSRIDGMGHVMDNYGFKFDSFDPQATRAIDPLCGPPETKAGEIKRLSEWRADGFDPALDCPNKAEVMLPGLPHLTPRERELFGVPVGMDTVSGRPRHTAQRP